MSLLETIRKRHAENATPSVMLTDNERKLLVSAVAELECAAADWIRGIAKKYRHVDTYVDRSKLGELLTTLAPNAAAIITDEQPSCPEVSPIAPDDNGPLPLTFPKLEESAPEAE